MFIEVKEYGAKVGISGGRLTVTKDSSEMGSFPVDKVDSVSIHSSVQISSQAVASLSKRGIKVAWVNGSGMIICCTSADSSRGYARRRGQYKLADSEITAMSIAAEIIHAKITGQLEMLLSLGDTSAADKLRILSKRTYFCENSLALMGIEGEAARLYFDALKPFFPRNASFESRTKHPPRDRANAVLSYSYTLLYNRLVLEIISAGLDPYCGFLHKNGYARYTLACDIAELFRAQLSDRAALLFLSNCDGSYFEDKGNAVYLSDIGMKRFSEVFSAVLDSEGTARLRKNGFENTWKGCIKSVISEIAASADRESILFVSDNERRCG